MEREELSPQMHRPFLGSLPEGPRGSQGHRWFIWLNLYSHPTQALAGMLREQAKVPSGLWSLTCLALFVTSSK